MKTWKIKKILKSTTSPKRRQELLHYLLKTRNLDLYPPKPNTLTAKSVNIDSNKLRLAIKLIKTAIKHQDPIIIYGDYDADGICATAILWETLHSLGAQVTPFIPHRFKHGYGISPKGIDQIKKTLKSQNLKTSKPLIITVDNGIVAHTAVKYAQAKGFQVIVTDHHVKAKTSPPADAIVHTTKLAGAGVSWFLSKVLWSAMRSTPYAMSHLELAAIGTIADMVALIDANRCIASYGLKALQKTRRPGLLKLFSLASIDPQQISTYEINFIIAPRLNAMGRLDHALESLRLLCTPNKSRASQLARKLSDTNKQRQDLTNDQLEFALNHVKSGSDGKIIIVKSPKFHEGVIGLIAGRLTETYFLPSVVLSQGKNFSKASARSIPGFNLIKALRQLESLLVDVGGHPMAAGLTIKNSKIPDFIKKLQQIAQKQIKSKTLQKTLSIDCLLNSEDLNLTLFDLIQEFAPFGIKNPRPLFALKNVIVSQAHAVGQDKSHLKLTLENNLSCIGFGLGEYADKLSSGSLVDLAFSLDQNIWNNQTTLQLKLKDIKSIF